MNVPLKAIVETRLLITPVRTQLVDSFVNVPQDLVMKAQLESVVSKMQHLLKCFLFSLKYFHICYLTFNLKIQYT